VRGVFFRGHASREGLRAASTDLELRAGNVYHTKIESAAPPEITARRERRTDLRRAGAVNCRELVTDYVVAGLEILGHGDHPLGAILTPG
jgi:hypothetical protein